MARAERDGPDHEESSRAQALAGAFTAPRPGVEERMAAGKALRERVPRASHGVFERPPQVDPLAILQAQAATRLQQLVPVRHARMLQSPTNLGAALREMPPNLREQLANEALRGLGVSAGVGVTP